MYNFFPQNFDFLSQNIDFLAPNVNFFLSKFDFVTFIKNVFTLVTTKRGLLSYICNWYVKGISTSAFSIWERSTYSQTKPGHFGENYKIPLDIVLLPYREDMTRQKRTLSHPSQEVW